VGPRAGLDAVEKRKDASHVWEPNPGTSIVQLVSRGYTGNRITSLFFVTKEEQCVGKTAYTSVFQVL